VSEAEPPKQAEVQMFNSSLIAAVGEGSYFNRSNVQKTGTERRLLKVVSEAEPPKQAEVQLFNCSLIADVAIISSITCVSGTWNRKP